MRSKSFQAIAALVGTTIGAGIFGLPYVVAKIGFIPGTIYLVVLGLLTFLLNLAYGEVILRTSGDHQLTGYASIYLGKGGRVIAFLALLLTVYGALLAYFIKIGEFLNFVFGFGSPVYWSLAFLGLAGLALFFGLRTVGPLEGFLVALLLGLLIFLSFLGFSKIKLTNFSDFDPNFLFLPYGVMLFALSGSSVVPEMEEILRQEHGKLKKAIIVGTVVPLAFYFLFVTLVVGVCGRLTSDDAVLGLAFFLPIWIVDLGALLGILTMGTSFLTLGYVLREVYFRDFGTSKILSWVLVCLGSPLFYLFGAKNFIEIIGATGALMGGLTGILIVLMFLKAKKIGERRPAYVLSLPRFLFSLLVFVFILGIVWQLGKF
jgi:tyrosine-specific transport protein